MALFAHSHKDRHRQREYDGTVRDIRVIPPDVPTVHLTTFKKLAIFISLWFANAVYLLLYQIGNFYVNALNASEKEMRMLKLGACHVTLLDRLSFMIR